MIAARHSSERQAEYQAEMRRQARIDAALAWLFFLVVAFAFLAMVTV